MNIRNLLSLLFVLIILLFQINNISAETIYVDHSASGSNTGTSWSNAFTSFQSALNAAILGDQIWVAKGTYKPDYDYDLGGGSRYFHFRLRNGIAIYGGFAGTETNVNQRIDFSEGEINETILSGDLEGNDVFDVNSGGYQGTTGDDNCYHVFFHTTGTDLDNSALLNGFTIRGGKANDNGGGMLNDGSSPTLEQINFKENIAALGGGGINNNNSSSPLILNCVFHSNISLNTGGAIDMWNSSNATIINSLFYHNTSYAGGAIIVINSSSYITNTSICHNTATSGGGLSCALSGSAELNNCIIWDNEAANGNQIYLSSSAGESILNYSCYSNSANDIVVSGGTFTATNNNINTIPDFVSAATGNFRLFSNSPTVNAGLNSYNSQTNDIRGELRIQDVTIDMGAFEWTSGVDPKVVFVNTLASGANDGSCWSDAFNSLQSALDIVASGDQIWVAKGTYKPSYDYGYSGDSRQYHFELSDYLAVYGGFTGTETAIEERSYFGSGESNETVLSGDIGIIGDSTDNCYHVIFNWNNGNNSLLDGFTVKLGNASEGMTTSWGGGLYFNNVSSTMQNITFESNYGILGGGIFLWNSTLTATNMLIKSNCAVGGAGIYCSSSSVNLNNASLINNDVTNDGGAIFINGTSIIAINNCILWGNHALGDGNEIYIDNGSVSLNYSCFSNNTGDVINSGGTLNPTECISVDPLFVNTAVSDFRLVQYSPAVDAGHNSYNSLTTDIRGAGYPRKLNKLSLDPGTIDMGAYEYNFFEDNPLPVILSNFNAVFSNEIVTISWMTQSETDNLGWNIYRNIIEDLNESVQLNSDIIPGAGTTSEPTYYSYPDELPVENAITYYYWLESIDLSGFSQTYGPITVIIPPDNDDPDLPAIPEVFGLYQNYPNPFNPSTTISFCLEEEAMVNLIIYDIKGRIVKTVYSGMTTGGILQTFIWDGADENGKEVGSGMYFYSLKTDNKTSTRKMILLR